MDPTMRRSPITIQKQGTTRDPTTNELNQTWSFFKRIFVTITPMRGKERFMSGSLESTVTHQMRGHHYDGVDITTDMRIVYEGRVFKITHVILDHDEHRELMLGAVATDETP